MSSLPGGNDAGVFCHQCDNEWTRQDHGLVCPACGSDFVEVIENDTTDDPRDERLNIDGLAAEFGAIPFSWPDPPSPELYSDSANTPPHLFAWGADTPGRSNFSDGPRDRSSEPDTPPPPQSPPSIGGILGFISNALGGQTQQATTSFGPATTRTTTWQSPSGNAHFSMTMSSNSYGGGRDAQPTMTPLAPNELSSFMNNIFSAPISPGGTQYPLPGFGSPGGQSTTLLDILLGGRLGLPGQYAQSQEDFDRIISDLMERSQTNTGAPAASNDVIAHLPKKAADLKMLGETGKAECTICMAEVTKGETVTELYCKHWFHSDCIKAWLEQHNTCPHCRMSVEEAKQNFERQEREAAESQRSASSDNDPERKRKRGSLSSMFDNGRSRSRSTNAFRMPGAFQESPAHDNYSSSPNASLQFPVRSATEHSSMSNARLSRSRPSFSPRTRRSSQPSVSPRRTGSGDVSFMYSPRHDSLLEEPRHSAHPPQDLAWDRQHEHDYAAYPQQRRHSTYDAHGRHSDEPPSLLARARDWFGGR